jgi:hypothetical protein
VKGPLFESESESVPSFTDKHAPEYVPLNEGGPALGASELRVLPSGCTIQYINESMTRYCSRALAQDHQRTVTV